ncbi:MAG: TlpA disulfide reductase family protein [Chitinophagaceae bacterium]
MKKLLLTLCAVQGVLIAMCQQPVTISGQTTRRVKEPVKLFSITHGRLEELASSKADSAGRFGFLFYPGTEGFYVIGSGSALIAADKYMFYFKPGDALSVSINDTTYTLTGKNSPENLAITDWHSKGLVLERPSIYALQDNDTYMEFFPKLENFVAQLPSYKPLQTNNKKFDANFARIRRIDLLAWAIGFISSPNSVHPTAADYTAYYKGIKVQDYAADAFMLQYPFGVRLLSWLPMATALAGGEKVNGDLEAKMANVQNDTLRGELVLLAAGSLKTYTGFLDLRKNYGRYIITADQQRRETEISAKLAKEAAKPGQAAINFTYPDIDGKKVSLTDFKGKVVLVDVWATWCGPCKVEIPHLKKMEEEMRDKDVVFMSVSVDENKDLQKWKDYVGNESLKGVQLFASGWSDIARNYEIKAIPRFMVFDKKGNIVTIDGPRPSGKELRLLLEEELKK